MVQNNEINNSGDQLDQRAEARSESTEKMSAEVAKVGSPSSYSDCKAACEKEVGAAMSDTSKWKTPGDVNEEALKAEYKAMTPAALQAQLDKNDKAIDALKAFLKAGASQIGTVEESAKQQERMALEARKNGQ